jgi:uncharacterized membrane protein YcaP (DUF421 family)
VARDEEERTNRIDDVAQGGYLPLRGTIQHAAVDDNDAGPGEDSLPNQWLADVFSHPDPIGALAIAAKTALIYVFLVIGLRLLGKRELGQMSIYDLVLIVVLANSVQNAMVGSDTSLGGGLVAALTLLILNRVFTWLLVKYPALQHNLIGEPVLIAKDGRLLDEQLRQEGVTAEEVMAALREHGLERIEDARMCVLEVDGTISVVPKEAIIHRTRHRVRALRIQ